MSILAIQILMKSDQEKTVEEKEIEARRMSGQEALALHRELKARGILSRIYPAKVNGAGL